MKMTSGPTTTQADMKYNGSKDRVDGGDSKSKNIEGQY